MKVTNIIASADNVRLQISGLSPESNPTVKAFVPLICGNSKENKTPGRLVFECHPAWQDGFVIPRFCDSYDLSICRFEV